jgi:UDP-N-acetylglucosamine 2-epimerase (non-hydrolysing)
VAAVLARDERTAVRALVADAAAPTWNALLSEGVAALPTTMVHCGLEGATGLAELLAAGHRLAAEVLAELESDPVDMLMVMGDRHELLPVALAALLSGAPVAHLSGGDITEGAFDDSVRHALTKLSHLHLCTTDAAARRVRQMGEEPWRVIVTGEPALDGLVEAAATPWPADSPLAGVKTLAHPAALVTYHPPTMAPERLDAELEALIGALDGMAAVVATHPAAEPGAERIVERLQRWARANPAVHVVPQLGGAYARLLAEADLVAGNSSSGIVEAASFGTPVVNVGDRQRGRLHPANVIDTAGEAGAVAAAVDRAMNPGFRASLAGLVNPYGDGHAAEHILDAIVAAPLDRLWQKRFVDLEGVQA